MTAIVSFLLFQMDLTQKLSISQQKENPGFTSLLSKLSTRLDINGCSKALATDLEEVHIE